MDFRSSPELRAKLEAMYGHIELNDQEKLDGMLEAKIKKFFHERNPEYWIEAEARFAETAELNKEARKKNNDKTQR
jgi:hypothetical protein